jgi:hypothetical protein
MHLTLNRAVALLAVAMLSLLACGERPASSSRPFDVRVHADDGKPLANVKLYMGPTLLCRTGTNGVAHLFLAGGDASVYKIRVECPVGSVSPTDPLAVTPEAPDYDVVCRASDGPADASAVSTSPHPADAEPSIESLYLSPNPRDQARARAILESRVFGGHRSSDDVRLLKAICKSQRDMACLQSLRGL